ncbi:hypothetical protein M9Y10_030148 [Tritrichomonas musculus]|uniref:BEACH domain-containing protein n=1 Tax=Tritrichomonas musculus TaxID=1915356 RepID=A0ABR2KP59_9EUKA
MTNSDAYLQILHFFDNPSATITESPLIQLENIQFDKDVVNIENYFNQYNSLLNIDDSFCFNHINFLEITQKELLSLKDSYFSKSDSSQKQYLIIFMLLTVLKHNSFYDIFDSEGIHYNLLFNPLFLPSNPNEKCFKHLIHHINNFLYEEYHKNSVEIIQAITSYIKKIDEDSCIYNFLPFLIKLFQSKNFEFIENFIKSDLFDKVLEISQKELPIFDFYRHIVYEYPEIAFQKTKVTQSMLQLFFVENRSNSIVFLIEKAIKKFVGHTEILNDILIVLSLFISQAHEKGKEKSKLVFGLLYCIDHFFNAISSEIDLSSFFDAVATFAVYSENENSFELFIDLIRKLFVQKPSFIFQLKKHPNFFNTLSKCQKEIDYQHLINLAKLNKNGMIHLYQIISVILSLIQKVPQNEEKVANELLILAQNNGNIIELDNAKVPDFILKRLPIIQEEEDICEKYLELFSLITAKIFHRTTFLNTIELLKNQEFKYSSSILNILNTHLDNFLKNNIIENNNYLAFQYRKDQLNLHNEPFSFYRFDNRTGCGINCPKIELSAPLTFCFWLRINEIEPNEKAPLIYFYNDKYKFDLYIRNNKVFLDGTALELPNCPGIEQGKWYFYCLSIERVLYNFSLTLNLADNENVNYTSNKVKIQFCSGEYKLHICQRPVLNKSEIDYPSIICDMSVFLLVSENIDHSNIRNKMIDFLSSNDLNINYFSHLLCLFNPSQSHDNICFNVSKNLSNVQYSGTIIPIIPNFYDVVQNIESIQTFLPLIGDLSNDQDNEKGKEILHLILSIFCRTINICEKSFLKSRFFELLVSFLYDCEMLIYKETFKDLLEMYLKIKDSELKKSFLKSIYLNYEFLSNLFDSVETLFYSYSPLQLYQTKENDYKIVFDDLSMIIYTGVKYFDGSEKNSQYYWNYIKRLCLDSPNDKNINCLIDFLKEDTKIKSKNVSIHIFDILYSIFKEKNEIDKSFTDFTPYIITYSQYNKSVEILKLTLMIFNVISKKTNMKDKIYPSIYHLMIVFRPSLYMKQKDIEMFINLTLEMITKEQMISFTSILTIFLKCSKSDDKNKEACNSFANSEYVQNNVCLIPFWTYWLTKLFLTVQPSNPKEFANLCISCLKDSSSMIELLDFFDICDYLINHQKEFFISVKENILIYMINNKKVDYSYVYNFMLFSVETTKKENNFPLSYFGDFVEELFCNFDINVTLRTTVNKELLAFLITKTQTLLTKIISMKAQLCGGKIEVPIKDINSYLSNLQENMNVTENESDEKAEKYTSISFSILNKCLDSYKEIIEKIHKGNLKWSKDLSDTLKFERQYTESEDAPIEYKLLFVFDLEKFNFYYNEKHEFISELQKKYTNENNFLNKMKKSFIESISLLPGPWERSNKNKEIKRFKLLNRVSKSGKKILMRINKTFNDHSDASKNRSSSSFVNKIDKLVYKQIETAPEQSKKTHFKTKVFILSQSKEEEGFMEASEHCISLTTETSNKFIYWDEIEFIMNRKEAHFENSCEIFKNNGHSYFIKFVECKRKYFYSFIDKLKLNHENKKCKNKFDFFNSLRHLCNGIYQNKKIQSIIEDIDLINLWKTRKITTFSYLYYLNLLCGRSFNDIQQYIVYPFILSDAESKEISLNEQKIYREMNLPVNAICESILQSVIDRYVEFCDLDPYLFSEIPSSSLVVSWYLLRTEPYTTIHVTKDQQNGIYPKFDNPDRLFNSIKELVKLLIDSGLSKEMIPEFFSFPFFLINENNFDLGKKSATNKNVDDVELPNWSGSYYSFVSTLRLMLEGSFSDEFIGRWIDLTFGINRRVLQYNGNEYNIYKSYFYPETSDPAYKEEVIQFGCIPDQILTEENPMRDKPSDPLILNATISDKRNVARFVKNILVCPSDSKAYEITNENPENLIQLNLKDICGKVLCYSRSLNLAIYGTKADPFLTFYNLKTSETKIECQVPFIITAVYLAAGRYLVTGGKDCSIRVWDILRSKNQKVTQISSSMFHTDHIKSIGCCFDNGLLVSSDRQGNLIFETLIDHVFINSVSLNEIVEKMAILDQSKMDKNDVDFANLFSFASNQVDFLNDVQNFIQINKQKDSFIPSQICVFKSGLVAVSCDSSIFFFDTRGKLMAIKTFESDIVEIHKCYNTDTREFLIVGAKPDKIYVFDAACLQFIVVFDSYFSSITSFQKSCSFVTYYKEKIQTFDFSQFVQPIMSKVAHPLLHKSTYK